AGLAQRARLMAAILADLYGPQRLLAEGKLPPALVFANPGFLRPCHSLAPLPPPDLQLYAADLVRGPDGAWRVLADRLAGPAGLGLAQENRRLLGRVLPELFRGAEVAPLRPFFEFWQDALYRLAPAGRAYPGIALLSPGTRDPLWYEHMLLSRALGSALVEGADLTVRSGVVFLKTLKGLQQIDVLLRRLPGAALDPLELAPNSTAGVVGLMAAMREATVRIVNHPGADLLEAPALAAFLPALCKRLLGEELKLASLETIWLGEEASRERFLAAPEAWLLRPALDGAAAAVAPAAMAAEAWLSVQARLRHRAWEYAATEAVAPSVAPAVTLQGSNSGLIPRPLVLRLFLAGGADAWRAMPGGLARLLEPGARLAGRLPQNGVAKDVWVLAEEDSDLVGPTAAPLPKLPIRRTVGELPSRAADDSFWLGRYVERLEDTARLVRAALARLERGRSLPREYVERQSLDRILLDARLIDRDATASPAALAAQLLAVVRPGGAVNACLEELARLTERSRDRLTSDMYAAFTQSLRAARTEAGRVGRSLDTLAHAMQTALRFSTIVAGIAAENMVRGGTWLFLELGRRLERAHSVARIATQALAEPPSRIETGLTLMLDLCDSAITYRSRYLTLVQPAPVLDLVLADEANPRALAFQLAAIHRLLADVAAGAETSLAEEAAALLEETVALVARVSAGADQAVEAAVLPPRLAEIGARIGALSDRLSRRYFALLPAAQALGFGEAVEVRGAA
ncbi:MAG TPA: circularly permuted type 2 ATP-grasp protein, partial [Acetobacteraceae bacterium]|nr:circularly permuted type 2 ATP-grasp protein [Acetobacteraceae bacterium]